MAGKPTGRVDIDLSATFYSNELAYLNHVSYTNLKLKQFGAFHSGDITSAPAGAAEFIDVEIEKACKAGARYLVTSVQAFTSHPFCNLPECFTGWMSRNQPQQGEIFEPSTVEQKIDLASDSRVSVPTVIDLKERVLYWADFALRANPNSVVAIESNQRGLVHYAAAILDMHRPSLFDLFLLHARARGELQESGGDCDCLFSVGEGITPLCTERIISEFLS